jgi:hypothetical protein
MVRNEEIMPKSKEDDKVIYLTSEEIEALHSF